MHNLNSFAWDETWPLDLSIRFLAEFSTAVGEKSPTAAYLSDLIRAGKYLEVIEHSVDMTSVDDYFYGSIVKGLVQKNPWIPMGLDPERAAVAAFLKAEQQCEETNRRLYSLPPKEVSAILLMAQRKISAVLGDVPSLHELQCRFGPGASTNVSRAQACLEQKLSAQLACSRDMIADVGRFLAETPDVAYHHARKDKTLLEWYADDDTIRYRVDVEIHAGRLVFVPKNAKTHRSIVVEPVLNGLWQLAVGDYLKGRLLRVGGQDLKHGQERQRMLAREGSINGDIATIDLSSASDTISLGLVLSLLPPAWSEFLGTLRTGEVEAYGGVYELEKFSSMGNGFTFELESLIFWALAASCVEQLGLDCRKVGVYGDDIIVPVGSVPLLLECLSYCGFTVNTEKSFWMGPFRESCGSDWLLGTDVRPWFLKEELSDRVLYSFHNWLMRRGETSFASFVRAWLNPTNRLYGPDGYGDGHLIGDYSLYLPRAERRRGYCGGYFDTYQLAGKRSFKKRPGDWLVPSYTIYRKGNGEEETMAYVPGVLPGTFGYERRSLYTFRQGVFL